LQFLRLIQIAILLQTVCVAIETASAVGSTVLHEKLIIAHLVKFFFLKGSSQFMAEVAAASPSRAAAAARSFDMSPNLLSSPALVFVDKNVHRV
jgi:hypothetical protein